MEAIRVGWLAPSNLALVKYWGKKGIQEPINPSLSMTLSQCVTKTWVTFTPGKNEGEGVSFDFLFEGKPRPIFDDKIGLYLEKIASELPFLRQGHLHIESMNTFPHSSGIASSASSMASLSLCLVELSYNLEGRSLEGQGEPFSFFQKVSHMARLGSGSAARSVAGPWMSWGELDFIKDELRDFAPLGKLFQESSDSWATTLDGEHVHDAFLGFKDYVFIASEESKKVSSTEGHRIMDNHPQKEQRISQAQKNYLLLLSALEKGDLGSFMSVVEEEALSLHALMLTGTKPYVLLNERSQELIRFIRETREKEKVPWCFTLDAGPNVHVLFPARAKEVVEKTLSSFTYSLEKYPQRWIKDELGAGPQKLNHL